MGGRFYDVQEIGEGCAGEKVHPGVESNPLYYTVFDTIQNWLTPWVWFSRSPANGPGGDKPRGAQEHPEKTRDTTVNLNCMSRSRKSVRSPFDRQEYLVFVTQTILTSQPISPPSLREEQTRPLAGSPGSARAPGREPALSYGNELLRHFESGFRPFFT